VEPSPLQRQHDLADMARAFHARMGGRRLIERKLLFDDHLKLADINQPTDLLQPDAVHDTALEPRCNAVLLRQCFVRRRCDGQQQAALADYVTIGECCTVLRRVFGEYRPGEEA